MKTQEDQGPFITVSVVDDISVVCEVLAKTINRTDDLRCVSTHVTAQEALREIPRLRPRVVLMDKKLPRLSGAECTRRLKVLVPELRVLMLSVDSSGEAVWGSLLAGADGYCVKAGGFASVPEAIRTLIRDGRYLCPQAEGALVELAHEQSPARQLLASLTAREMEIVGLLEHLTEKEIAMKLQRSVATVHVHLKTIYRKLGVHCREEAVRVLALARGEPDNG